MSFTRGVGMALTCLLGFFSCFAINYFRQYKGDDRPLVVGDAGMKIKCSFTNGPFNGNHFVYEIKENPLQVKLAEVLDGDKVFIENYEPIVISRKDGVIVVSDPRLLESEKTLYIDKIDLKEMRLSSSVIHDLGTSTSTLEDYMLGCQRIQSE